MRVFIALELPEDFVSDIAGLARSLKASLEGRFLGRDSYHLTLAFLGEVDEAVLASATDALEAACAGLAPIPLRSDGLGKFGRPNDATVWLGISPTPELQQLARRVREELAEQGIAFDTKPFKPHITLARRVRIPRADLPGLAFPRDSGARVVSLFKSTLSREGAEYRPLHSVELEGKEGPCP